LLQENEKELADEDDTDAVTNKVLSALGILNTLSTLILSVETKPEMVRALEESLEPVLVFVLDNAVYGIRPLWRALTIDLLSEALEIIDSLTFSSREISPRMWRFFPLLHSCFKLNASDYLEGTNTYS
jgi:importin-7